MVRYSAMQKYHEFLRAVTEHAADGILAFGRDGTVILANRAVANLFGLPEKVIEGRRVSSILEELTTDAAGLQRLAEALETEENKAPIEISARRADGSMIQCEVAIGMAQLSDGETIFIANCRDVRDRRAIEDRLRRLARIIDQMKDGVLVLDSTFTVIESNQAMERFATVDCDMLFGCPATVVLDIAFPPEVNWAVICAAALREGFWNQVVDIRCHTGETIKVDMAVYPLWNLERDVIAYAAAFRDVTARLEAENRIIQTQKIEALGRLAGGVAHDVNNLLFPIFLNLESALDHIRQLPDMEDTCEELQESMDACLKIKSMIQQILHYSRKNAVDVEPLDISSAITDAWSLARMLVPSSAEKDVHIEANCGQLTANSVQISQILLNLVSNSVAALDGGMGLIRLSLTRSHSREIGRPQYYAVPDGDIAIIALEDNGAGIDDVHLARIFEPFFTTKDVGKGTGLGLTEVAGIIKSLSGAISVFSERGKGTRFEIYLPVS